MLALAIVLALASCSSSVCSARTLLQTHAGSSAATLGPAAQPLASRRGSTSDDSVNFCPELYTPPLRSHIEVATDAVACDAQAAQLVDSGDDTSAAPAPAPASGDAAAPSPADAAPPSDAAAPAAGEPVSSSTLPNSEHDLIRFAIWLY